ncbi:MAG TPA: epoxide hydrolase [Candidatus Polarisedimenticolia bacterium]|jgi:pimeloyl-ACP methyl ester carboxylesterase
MNTEPFRIEVTRELLRDLSDRLERTRWPDEIDGARWSYGVSPAYLRELVEYWRDSFDWRGQEERLNSYPQFRATVEGAGIHFIQVRGRGPSPLPIVLTHGWPGSFVEMLKIVPLLADPASHGGDPADAFDVVVPSLPGYGFSDRPRRPGMNAVAIAALWARLMEGLGYGRFAAQGGDWGASVTTWLGLAHHDRLAGIHLNYIPGSYSPWIGPGSASLTEAERGFLMEAERWDQEEGGYAHLQRTRPQTAAFALNDSPVGLAAWIVEKFRDWSDCDGDVERRFTKDELLTNVMIYWITETIGSSSRLYFETRDAPVRLGRNQRVKAPCGVARFPREAPFPPREWVERSYDVRRWTEMPRGGHFAAMEEPELLAADLRDLFRPLR